MRKFLTRLVALVRREPVVTSGVAGAVVLNIVESVFHVSPGALQLVSDVLLAAGIPAVRSLVSPAKKAPTK